VQQGQRLGFQRAALTINGEFLAGFVEADGADAEDTARQLAGGLGDDVQRKGSGMTAILRQTERREKFLRLA
jgi:hypothetical protein